MTTEQRISIHNEIIEKLESISLHEKQILWRQKDIEKAGSNPIFPNLIERYKMQVETKKALILLINMNIQKLQKQLS